MLRHLKQHTVFILYIGLIVFHSACSDMKAPSFGPRSAEEYQEVEKSYKSVLKMWPVRHERIFVDTSYGNTHIITWGKKNNPPLMLFHGIGNCALIWIFIAEQLADHFYVIAPDTVGDPGLSVPKKSFKSPGDYAGWFSELLDGMGLAAVNVAGFSWGGGISLQIALQYPDRIKRMVVMSPAWGLKTPGIWPLLQYVIPVVLFPNAERVRSLFEWIIVKRPDSADKKLDALIEFFVVGFKHNKFPGMLNPAVFSDKELKQIKVPILLIFGDHEVLYSDPLAVMKRAKDNIPGINVKLIPHAGHFLIFDRPHVIGKEILVFLKGRSG